jgi:pimeloyl-ACP methyl ester carboxylesterase
LIVFVNGHNLHVEISGPETGSPVVLLHHGLGSTKAWRGQVPSLVQAGYRVITYDRWGYGESDAREGLDLPSFGSDLKDLGSILDQFKTHRAVLVGHSDGGTIALYFAAQQPERVGCLVLVAAHVYIEQKMEPGILGVQQAFMTEERFRAGLRYAHGDKYEMVFSNWFNGWHTPEAIEWDMRPILSQIRCPTLVVQGEEDEHATPQHAEDIAAVIPGAELCLLPGARHMLPQENMAEFNTKTLQFLKDHVSIEQC